MTQTVINPVSSTGAMKDNIEVLKKGYMVILPILDEAGRPILWIDGNALSSHTTVDDVSFSCMILLNQRYYITVLALLFLNFIKCLP